MPEDAVLYETRGALAFVTLNRPKRLNAIDFALIEGLEEAVARGNREPEVRVIVLRGAGRAFCAGYDLQMAPSAEAQAQERSGGWDPVADFRMMSRNGRAFMGLWEARKPGVAQAHGRGGAAGAGAGEPRRPRRPSGGGGRVVRREAGDDAGDPAGDDEAAGQPGVREHGAAHDADPGDVHGRDRAAHAGGAGLGGPGAAGGGPGGGPPPRRA